MSDSSPTDVCQWTVFDRERTEFTLVTARDWKEAVLKAAESEGVLARRNLDVRPRTGDFEVAGREEFQRFKAKHF